MPQTEKVPANTSENATVAVAVKLNVVPESVCFARRNCVPARLPSVQVVCAVPSAAVTPDTVLTLPPPVSESLHVTASPAMAFPYWSVTLSESAVASAALTAPVCPAPETTTIARPVSGCELAVKPIGVRPVTEADALCGTATVPSVHVTWAVPSAEVVSVSPASVPLESPGVQVTRTPDFTYPYWSVSLTTRGAARARPTRPVCVLPLTSVSRAGAPDVAVAVKTALSSTKPFVRVATALLAPRLVPSVHVEETSPVDAEALAGGFTEPPPERTEKVTVAPSTGKPLASTTLTTSC